VLATTDIHAQLVSFDYVNDCARDTGGLAGVATLINAARHEAAREGQGCILLDNGDLLQGNALGDWLADQPVTADHAIVASFNHLRYDAVGLGNHDFDHGMTYLNDIVGLLHMPVICSNLRVPSQQGIHRSALIDCALPVPDGGNPANLRVGVLSVLPRQTAIWNRHVMEDTTAIEPARDCLERAVPALRAAGAEIVILLAHMGIGGSDRASKPDHSETALGLADIPGIDAMITGHTHRRFPGRDHVGRSGVDSTTGTLRQCPAIMPGFGGSDLAVLDLALCRSENAGWQVNAHAATLRSNNGPVVSDPAIVAASASAHARTRSHLSQPVGQTDRVLHNYFSLAMPTTTADLSARAMGRIVRDALVGTPDAAWPVLASIAAHTAGGRGGPDHFLHIPAGPILRRHLAGLSPYADQIWALRVTGAQLRQRLETSALVFSRLQEDTVGQMLADADVPAYNFDTVHGITYRIDPTRAPMSRITSLLHRGRPIADDDTFILATNQFRAAGGGGFNSVEDPQIALRTTVTIEAALVAALGHPDNHLWVQTPPWSFQCTGNVQAILETAPAGLQFLDDIAPLSPRLIGTTHQGFAKIAVTL